MPVYKYIAKNSSGVSEKGSVDEENQKEAVKKLREKGLIIIDIRDQNIVPSPKSSPFTLKHRVSDKDKIIFSQQFSIMIKAGIPVTQALHSAVEESSNPTFSKVIDEIARDVEGGVSLSQAFSKHPQIFNQIFVSVLKAGEKSGKLEEVLLRLADQMEKDYDVKSKVKGALSYPIFVLSATFIIVGLIMIFVIPQIQAVFQENNTQLPFLTQIIIGISMLIRHQYIYLISAVAGLIWAYRIYSRSPSGIKNIDTFKLHIPVLGNLIKKSGMARFARTFSTLMAAGLPMLEIFDTSKTVIGNSVFEKEITLVSKDVENGLELSAALRKQPNIPKMMVQLTAVGEKSGNIDEVYDNMANFMEKEVDHLTQNLATLLEPALMLIMGVVIGTIVVSILLPIYSFTSSSF